MSEAAVARNSAELNVGRLVEIRADAGYRTVADVNASFARFGAAMSQIPEDSHHIVVADSRRCPIMSPDAAEQMTASIAQSKPGLLRSAVLTRVATPTAVLQFARVIRESNHPDRKIFVKSEDVIEWLDDVMTPEESARLRDFLAYR
jgi:hypothetical protein